MTAIDSGGNPGTSTIRWARPIALVLCTIAFSFGASALAGWIFDQPQWRSFLAGGSEMKANTSLALLSLAAGVALRHIAPHARSARLLGNLLAVGVGLIALLTLSQYVLHRDLGIDQAIFKDRSTIGTSHPGRMSPPTTVALCFGAIGMLLLDRETRRGWRPSQWFALATAFVPGHILMSYAYGNMNVLAFGSRKSYMAVPTALSLASLAVALLLYAPRRGLMDSLTARTQASRVFRLLLVALLIVPPLLGWFVLKVLAGSTAPPEFGVSTTIMLCIVFLAALAWFNAARLNRAETGLQQAKQEAERANHAKDQFLAMLSHELRTPLTPVLLTATMLEADPNVSPHAREQFAMIRRNIELEAKLIDDLLDVTRIAHGKFELREEVVDLHAAVDHALNITGPEIRAKELQVMKSFGAEQHHSLADAVRLQEVFWNILRNAVKFTPAHGKIEIATRNDGAGHILIDFVDYGMGIEPHLQARIFETFAQAEPAIRALHGGLGLGLAISKRIIDLHHGTIEVRSAGRGEGSTFTVTLNALEKSRVPDSPTAADPATRARTAATILIVEDHPDTARVLTRALDRAGYSVHHCGTVAEARTILAAQTFDLLISDIGLPDGTGLDLMRGLRDSQRLHAIALSGFGTEEDLAASKEAGFVTHLTKPVDLGQLRAEISNVLESEQRNAEARSDASRGAKTLV
jgi:signal transduction histidine kinase/ActR/RegA family two-component response regulator